MNSPIALWMQNILLAVSAFLIWLYVKATWQLVKQGRDQIDKTAQLVEAAQRQTEAAEAQLAILRGQIKDQEDAGRAAVLANISELERTAHHWASRMDTWGDLPPQPRLELLPSGWGVALEHARKTSGELYSQLHAIHLDTQELSMLIDKFTSKSITFRGERDAKQINDLIFSIMKQCLQAKTTTEHSVPNFVPTSTPDH